MPKLVAEAKPPETSAARGHSRWRSAWAGIASASAGVGIAEVVAALVSPRSSPLASTGALVIDLAPSWLKEAVISLFGTADKIVIIVAVSLAVAMLAGLAGIVETKKSPWGRVIMAAVGGISFFAAITRADSSFLSGVPAIIAIVIAVLLLGQLSRRSRAIDIATSERARSDERRWFLISSGIAAGFGVIAALGGSIAAASIQAVTVARRTFLLPDPAVNAVPIPAGASLDIPGIAPLVTPNNDFYRIDTALIVPTIDPDQWSLTITGMVEREVSITFEELLALPLEESYVTLACVSNYVGGGLIGNALWLGYPIRKLLAQAGPTAGADMVLSRSVDGFSASTPLSALTDDRNAILAVAMNGEPLPADHGFPVRMVVPGLYGYVSATKWVTQLAVTTFAKETAYWTNRGWSARGPVKLSSRIDTPRNNVTVPGGRVMIAGVAWSQHIGISRVEVRIDDGPWNEATLAEAISADTWRQWSFAWEATRGRHTLTVRATDAEGAVQTAKFSDVVPDGATGHHTIDVGVD
ncbi:MAG: molybdopterin-dependent oxidoreductase [Terrimesophilobacter sp.]